MVRNSEILHELLAKDALTDVELRALMITLRIEMDLDKRLLTDEPHRGDPRGQYPWLYLYCNWSAHIDINREPAGCELLADLTRLMAEHGPKAQARDQGAMDLLNDEVFAALFVTLDHDLGRYSFRNNLPNTLLVNGGFKQLYVSLAAMLVGRPLSWPSDLNRVPGKHREAARKHREAAAEMAKGTPYFVDSFQFHSPPSKYIPPGVNGVHWCVQTVGERDGRQAKALVLGPVVPPRPLG